VKRNLRIFTLTVAICKVHVPTRETHQGSLSSKFLEANEIYRLADAVEVRDGKGPTIPS
jgi:hypothetical protein